MQRIHNKRKTSERSLAHCEGPSVHIEMSLPGQPNTGAIVLQEVQSAGQSPIFLRAGSLVQVWSEGN